jgi:hypothetical protein
MLKFIGILVTLLYMTVTSGMAISIHYCMGEVSSVALGAAPAKDAPCGTCGMDEGCCHQETGMVKLSDAHRANPGLPTPARPSAEMHQHDDMDRQNEIPARWVGFFRVHMPPKAFDRNIHYRVFRI